MVEEALSTMSIYETISTGVSILALVIAGLSWIKSNKLAKLQIQEIEEKNKLKNKPLLSVAMSSSYKNKYFIIVNRGGGSAFNVNIELIDCEESPFTSDFHEVMPHPELKPAQVVKLLAITYLNMSIEISSKINLE